MEAQRACLGFRTLLTNGIFVSLFETNENIQHFDLSMVPCQLILEADDIVLTCLSTTNVSFVSKSRPRPASDPVASKDSAAFHNGDSFTEESS